MAKEKKQIEYDSALSEEKRFRKLVTDTWSKFWLVVVRVILMGMIALTTFVIASSYYDKEFFEDESGDGILSMSIFLTFMALANGMVLYTEMSFRRIQKARSTANGCSAPVLLYSTFPLTRKTVQKNSFRGFFIWCVLPIVAFNIILNVLAMIVDGFQPIMGSVGLTSMLSVSVMVIAFMCLFGVYKRTEKMDRIRTTLFWVMYFVFIGSTIFSGFFESCNNADFLRKLVGIPLIFLDVAAAVFILLREKLYYEKKLTFAAWFE